MLVFLLGVVGAYNWRQLQYQVGNLCEAHRYQQAQWTLGLGEADHPMYATNDVKQLVVDHERYPNGCTYSRTVEDDEDKDGLYVVRITVTWPEHGAEMKEEVVRYVLERKKD